jgi:hypothetical protein
MVELRFSNIAMLQSHYKGVINREVQESVFLTSISACSDAGGAQATVNTDVTWALESSHSRMRSCNVVWAGH